MNGLNPWVSAETESQIRHRKGSDRLLCALWREHPAIMRNLGAVEYVGTERGRIAQ